MSLQDDGISPRDYKRLCTLVYDRAGISLGTQRRTMLEVRIKRRLKELELHSYGEYCDYLFGHHGQKDEIVHLIDVVTTNKTDFFREPRHFDFLVNKAMPELAASAGNVRPFMVWSAGCSTGEEPYTLAMVMSEYTETHPSFRFRILASDISTTVLKRAGTGVYSRAVVEPVPAAMKPKYLMRSREPGADRVRIVPELRRQVEFRRVNFMDEDFGVDETFDVILCRNVIIYFDRATQASVLGKLCDHLRPGGYLLVGHAEALHDMELPLEPVAPATYRKLRERHRGRAE
jgi:chemotaxis protein methyltransferase CheR